jgi:3-phosphoshikimate 1-carboxyvinyltransferase
MPLPELIEIEPLPGPVTARITVPGSKSLTNRALVLAALARGVTTLRGALWSEDTQLMVAALQQLGFTIAAAAEPPESANRTLRVEGLGGAIPRAGTREHPLELFVGNAGTTARFLTALLCLGRGVYRLRGASRMHERPQQALFGALRQLGYTLVAANDRLPAVLHGRGPVAGACQVSIAESSQFASALLLVARAGGWQVQVTGQNAEESAYVAMTRQLLEQFPPSGGEFQIEPDASSGSYFWAANDLLRPRAGPAPQISVADWPRSDWQIDAAFPRFLPLPEALSRHDQLGDSIMTAVVLAPFAPRPVRFTDLGRLRLQECERVRALRTELTRCGARVEEEGDTLTVFPGPLRGATINTYHDHRLAMCFAILGLKVPGVRLQNPACVSKSFPTFFQKLAAPPPLGLGVVIRDATQDPPRPLTVPDLFAG